MGGMTYLQVSAGIAHVALLRSDGQVVACGNNVCGPCDIPALDDDVSYTQVSAGGYHTVLLRSDGRAVACGDNSLGQCKIPGLEEGMTYVQVSAGGSHTVLLRSDGHVVTCGLNEDGQRDIPSSEVDIRYTCDPSCDVMIRLIQLSFSNVGVKQVGLTCTGLNGEILCTVQLHKESLARSVQRRIAEVITSTEQNRLVLPDGRLLHALPDSTQVKDLCNLCNL